MATPTYKLLLQREFTLLPEAEIGLHWVLARAGKPAAQYLRQQVIGGRINGLYYRPLEYRPGASVACVIGHLSAFLGWPYTALQPRRDAEADHVVRALETVVFSLEAGDTPATSEMAAVLLTWIEAWLCQPTPGVRYEPTDSRSAELLFLTHCRDHGRTCAAGTC